MLSVPKAICVYYNDTHFTVGLDDGRWLCIMFDISSRLTLATPSQRRFLRIVGGGIGIQWPDIDEDLSVAGLIEYLEKRGLLVDVPDYEMLENEIG